MGVVKMSDLPGQVNNYKLPKSNVIRMGDIPDPSERLQKKILLKNNISVSEVFRQGQWEGQRCFILGGGQSVKDIDLSNLKNENIIAINMAFRLCEPSIIYGMDARLWGWIEKGQMDAGDDIKFLNSKAVKVWSDITAAPLPEDIIIAPSIMRPGISTNIREGVACGTNSGFGALNLALLLGAKEIYLIGYDFYGTRWHKGYPQGGQETMYGYHLQCYEAAAAQIRKEFPEQRIINTNSKSKLTCFEFGNLPTMSKIKTAKTVFVKKRAKKKSDPLFVGFYTVDNGYKKYALNMIKTLDRLRLEHDIQAVKSKGNWNKDTKAKANFLIEMRKRHPGKPLIWIDADAVIVRFPEELYNIEKEDVAVHYRDGEGLISSLIYFADTLAANNILKRWETECKTQEDDPIFDQKLLQGVIASAKEIEVKKLSSAYCYIIGIHNPDVEPVIEQHQASRRLKR